jgi:hypothetical protein
VEEAEAVAEAVAEAEEPLRVVPLRRRNRRWLDRIIDAACCGDCSRWWSVFDQEEAAVRGEEEEEAEEADAAPEGCGGVVRVDDERRPGGVRGASAM